eukprot:g19791.t1
MAGTEGGGAAGQVHFQAGLGFFPSLFGLQFQSFTFPTEPVTPAGERPGQTADGQPSEAEGTAGSIAARTEQSGAATAGARMLTSEEAQQAFLSRLLLMLGSFVVLCLVLF